MTITSTDRPSTLVEVNRPSSEDFDESSAILFRGFLFFFDVTPVKISDSKPSLFWQMYQ